MPTYEILLIAAGSFTVLGFLLYLNVLIERQQRRRRAKRLKNEIDGIVHPRTIEELRRIYEENKHGL